MTLENPEPIVRVVHPIQVDPTPIADAALPSPATRAATTEELRALEAVFAQKDQESAAVVGLLGAWNAGMLAHDLLQDFLKEEEEDEAGPQEQGKQKPKQ